MGGGGSRSRVRVPPMAVNPYEAQLANYAQHMWNQIAPARNYMAQDWENLFNPAQGRDYDPANLPAFSPLYNLSRTGLEDQYSVAKEGILSGLPRGGAQGRALSNLETGRAKDVGSLQASISAPIIQNLYDKAYQTAWQTGPAQAMGGLGTASGTLNQRELQQQQLETMAAAQNAQMAAQRSSSKGSGIGGMLGKGAGSLLGPTMDAMGGRIEKGIGGLGKGGSVGSGAFSGAMATGSIL